MAIQSFLVYTKPGRLAETCVALRAIPGAEATPAENENLVILVTETEGRAGTQSLEEMLDGIAGVDGYALVAGYADAAIDALETTEELV